MVKKSTSNRNEKWLHASWLSGATFLVYVQVGGFDFISYDDPAYLTRNPWTQQGFTLESIQWAFTAFHIANWHPVSWLSHMLDVTLLGMNPGGHHLMSLGIHVLNTLLLFLVLDRATRATTQSALVAGLFALHPMHVESVAWVAERKDVLSTLFLLLALGAYLLYVERRSVKWYLGMLALFALGLMSKPMVVTLPFVFLLLDYWPLNRISFGDKSVREMTLEGGKLVLEKVPMFALVIASSLVTIAAQRTAQTVANLETYSIYARIANAVNAYVLYLYKMLLPLNLGLIYTHAKDETPLLFALGSFSILCILTYLLCWRFRRFPYLAVGWLWFVGTLVPVIGLVQVGSQSMADRYSYIPFIGVFITMVWGASEYLTNKKNVQQFVRLGVVTVLFLCSVLTYLQAGYWRNNLMLFSHAVAINPGSEDAWSSLAYAQLLDANQPREAIGSFQKSLEIKTSPNSYVGIGMALVALDRPDDALEAYEIAIKVDPDNAEAHNNMAGIFASRGNYEQALEYFDLAIKYKPGYINARRNREMLLEIMNAQ